MRPEQWRRMENATSLASLAITPCSTQWLIRLRMRARHSSNPPTTNPASVALPGGGAARGSAMEAAELTQLRARPRTLAFANATTRSFSSRSTVLRWASRPPGHAELVSRGVPRPGRRVRCTCTDAATRRSPQWLRRRRRGPPSRSDREAPPRRRGGGPRCARKGRRPSRHGGLDSCRSRGPAARERPFRAGLRPIPPASSEPEATLWRTSRAACLPVNGPRCPPRHRRAPPSSDSPTFGCTGSNPRVKRALDGVTSAGEGGLTHKTGGHHGAGPGRAESV